MSRITPPAIRTVLPFAEADSSRRTLTRHLRRAVTAVVGLALTGALTQAPASAAQASTNTPGRVCMFSDPNNVYTGLAGHVGWAFKTGPDLWSWGSYSPQGKTWKSSWTWAATRDYFKRAGYYSFRCKDTHQMRSASATQVWKNYPRYNPYSSNCLTSSVAIFRAYTPELGSLPSASGTAPRSYFKNTLPHYGFANAWPL
ncbi:hypothetical protein ACWEU6_13940 [Streptosporangium sandarakinum]|uniref:hypothetical protein n=1 Tax=Streptosporangium sandarakinum TaxID=1260955 RepID=UPI0036B2092E